MEEQITCFLSGQRPAVPGKSRRSGLAGTAVIILSLILLPINAGAASENPGPYTPESILSFTEYLVGKGEYFRAWTELRRLESYYPGYISREKFDVTALYLMYKGKRYDEIAAYAPGVETGCAAGIIITDGLIMRGDYSAGLILAERNGSACTDDLFPGLYDRRKAYISLVTGEMYSDGKGTLKPELSAYRELVEYRIRMYDERKSPVLAAFLGLLPGCGYIYAGDEGTGFVAMTVIALFGGVTWGSYENGVEPLAILAGAVTLFFYGGNIAGGYLEVQKHNDAIDDLIKKKAESVLALDEDIDRIYIRFGISSNGK